MTSLSAAWLLALEAQHRDLEQEIGQLKKDIRACESATLSLEQFLNLSQFASSKLEAANSVAKDSVSRLLFLNLVVDTEKVVDYQMREPFATLMKTRKFLTGGPEANYFELLDPLYNAILQHWDIDTVDDDATNFDNLLTPDYNREYEY